jgi:hypothetical protein
MHMCMHMHMYMYQVIRENPASRGTEASAEVLVGLTTANRQTDSQTDTASDIYLKSC